MELNLYALKTFREVVDLKSFSRAANALFLTQPAVSLQLRSLENYFQTPLLIRDTAGHIELTREGEVLYKYACRLDEFQNELLQSMQRTANDFLTKFRLAACFIAGEHLCPGMLDAFQEKYPDTRLVLNILKCRKIFEGLLSGIFDIGITGVAPSHGALDKIEMVRVPLDLFQAGKKQDYPGMLSVQELLAKPLVLREEGAGVHQEFLGFLRKHRISLKHFKYICFSESNEAIKSIVKSGMGFSLLPRFMISDELKNNELTRIELKEGPLQLGLYLVFRKQDSLPEFWDRVMEFMTLEIKKMTLPAEA